MKRQASIETSGMIRSSIDGGLGLGSGDAGEDSVSGGAGRAAGRQFTPAVRQFSAPKAVKDPSAE